MPSRFLWVALALVVILTLLLPWKAQAEWDPHSSPAWEPLLWGGRVLTAEKEEQPSGVRGPRREEPDDLSRKVAPPTSLNETSGQEASTPRPESSGSRVIDPLSADLRPVFIAIPRSSLVTSLPAEFAGGYSREQFGTVTPKNIPPLYSSPKLPGEGVWEWKDMPTGENGWPLVYRTTYRPSPTHPNAIVHMLLFDMKRVSVHLYIGSSEPGAPRESSRIEPENKGQLVAITNALWKQKHSGEAGGVFRGQVLKKLAPGMATLAIYKDGSADVLEWNDGIPVSLVSDARQLKHLIVKEGKVVESIVQVGQRADSEIGLGYLLAEEEAPSPSYWGGFFQDRPPVNFGPDWFIATRSAFGIRRDGNLVFAVGHHISTKDLAKALVLAGCERAIHGDANPHNVLGNLYFTDEDGTIAKKIKLSPEQKTYTLQRYVDSSYTSDFFAFFRKSGRKDPTCRTASQ